MGKVNKATVEAIRAIEKNIVLGMTERIVRETLSNILRRAGMTPYFNVVLFGGDAANPHGGVDESRELEECEFVVIDVGILPDSSSVHRLMMQVPYFMDIPRISRGLFCRGEPKLTSVKRGRVIIL